MHRKHSTDAANKKKNDHTHCPADPEDCVLSQFYLYAQTNVNRIPMCVVGYYRESAGPNPPKLSVPWRAESETTTLRSARRPFGLRIRNRISLGGRRIRGGDCFLEVVVVNEIPNVRCPPDVVRSTTRVFRQLSSSVRFGSNIKSLEASSLYCFLS